LPAVLDGLRDDVLLSGDHLMRMTVVVVGSALAVLAARSRVEAEAARIEARATRERLEKTLDGLAEAVTVHDARGQTVYANEAAARLLGAGSPEEVLRAEPGQLAERFEIRDEHGGRVPGDAFPGRKLLMGRGAET